MKQAFRLLDSTSSWYYPVRSFILIAVGLILYGQTFHYGFHFDDEQFIVQNQYIRSFNHLDGVWNFLPFTRLVGIYSFALNYSLGGLNPVGYHIFNFIIHLLTTFLVWLLARLLFKIAGSNFKSTWTLEAPFFVALLFLVHPCQTQAVTYISQRFESMATLLYMSAIYCYLLARISQESIKRVGLLILSCVVSLFAILTKEVALTIPLMILALEWILKPGRQLQSTKTKNHHRISLFVFFILGCLFFFLFFKLVRAGLGLLTTVFPSASHDGDMITFGNYLLTQMRVFLTFLRLLVWPVHQNLDYDYPLSQSLINPPFTLLGLLFIIAIVAFIWKKREDLPLVTFGLAWMLITFSINLAPRENVIFEHKMYLISFGFLLSLVAGLFLIVRNRKFLQGILIGMVVVLSLLTVLRNQVWKDSFSLWGDVLQKSPQKLRVYINLAKAEGSQEQYERFIQILSTAAQKDPNNYGIYMARASMHFRLGQYDQSNTDLLKAITLRPNFFDYYKLSIGYSKMHQDDLAFQALNQSIDMNSQFARGYLDRALWFMRHKQFEQALKDFQSALSLNPKNIEALINRAGVWIELGHYDKALGDLDLALKFDPDNPSIRGNKAYCLKKMQNHP